MSEPTKVTEGPPTSAGFEEAYERSIRNRLLESRGLPFDPEEVPVDELKKKLERVDVIGTLHALQQVDTRITAAPHYERRIKALTTKEA